MSKKVFDGSVVDEKQGRGREKASRVPRFSHAVTALDLRPFSLHHSILFSWPLEILAKVFL